VSALPPAAAATPGTTGTIGTSGIDPDTPALLRPLALAIMHVNRALVAAGMVALLAAALVLTYSVVSRYLTKSSTDWQDEAAVFLLVGATFLCSAFVQSLRGHVGIEAIAGWLPRSLDRLRLMLVDLMCTLFSSFFAWKSWTLWHEAWAEGQTTSSSWAPPLWIPYGLMAAGMTLLSVQLLIQLSARANALTKGQKGRAP
jgi:TRAP-type C4-dicarboxylate transport system permease small subunit